MPGVAVARDTGKEPYQAPPAHQVDRWAEKMAQAAKRTDMIKFINRRIKAKQAVTGSDVVG